MMMHTSNPTAANDCLSFLKKGHRDILNRAITYSETLIKKAELEINEFLETVNFPISGICFVVVGSVGRREALEASDLDIIPITADAANLDLYREHDAAIRQLLNNKLGVKVSKGEHLTQATSVNDLIKVDTIGGSNDDTYHLTKRILILTEGVQAGGNYDIRDIRSKIICAYAEQERTSGRHILALCNDIARYYKTLCIEYKGRVDEEHKDWCDRNIKLRHSRKLWYFANIISIIKLSEEHPHGGDEFKESLLNDYDRWPIQRLANALSNKRPLGLSKLLENYALYLDFMSQKANRDALKNVDHQDRYKMSLDNPFPAMKFSSDIIHYQILSIIEELGQGVRAKIMGWFLF